MSRLPAIVPRRLAPPGTLAGDWLRASEPARALLPPGPVDPESRPNEEAASPAPGASGSPVPPSAATRTPDASSPPGEEAFGTSTPAAREKLRRILAGEGRLVSTGQQPLFLLGPLLVLYKALGAMEAARRLEEETGRPHLACFWIASDDHDWEEVGALQLLDTQNDLRTFRLPPPEGWENRPAGLAPLSDAAPKLMDDVFQALPDSEFIGDIITLFRDAWRPGISLASAFATGLTGLLRGHDLAWLDAGSEPVKRAAVPLLRWSLETGDAHQAHMEGGARRIRGAGYDAPIPVLPGATAVFLDPGTGRQRLYLEGDRFRLGRDGETFPREDLLDRLRDDPVGFSPNVALRPVLESWMLPVATTVLGPGEIAYWSQLDELFRAAAVRRPRIFPRPGWTLVEAKVEKVIDRLEAAPEDWEDGGEALARRAVGSSRPPSVARALDELRAGLGRGLERLEEEISRELPGIRSAVGKAKAEIFRAVGDLEDRVDARVAERQEVLLGQIRKAAAHLYPGGRPQERVMSPLYYLARYGPAFVEALGRRTRDAWLAGGSERS